MAQFDNLEFTISANTSLLRGELSRGTSAVQDFANKTETSLNRTSSHFNSLAGSIRTIFTLYGTIRAVRFFENLIEETMKAGKLTEDQTERVKAMTTSYGNLRTALAGFAVELFVPKDSNAIVDWAAAGIDKLTELSRKLNSLNDEFFRGPVLKGLGLKNGFQTGGGIDEPTASDLLQEITAQQPLRAFPKFEPGGPVLNAGQELTPTLKQFISDLEDGQKLTEQMATDVEKQVSEWHEAQRLFATGGISADTLKRFSDSQLQEIDVNKITAQFKTFTPALTEAEKEAKQFATAFSASFESRGIQALLDGDLSGAVRGLVRDFAELILRLTVLEPLAKNVANNINGIGSTNTSGGNNLGFWASLFGMFAGGFADGGRPPMGQISLVGERGPELFVPDSAGTIVPRGTMGGSTIVQNFTVQAGLPPMWEAQLVTVGRMAGQHAAAGVLSNLGGRR